LGLWRHVLRKVAGASRLQLSLHLGDVSIDPARVEPFELRDARVHGALLSIEVAGPSLALDRRNRRLVAQRPAIASSAAAIVASTAARRCAAEVNPASNCDGAR